MPDNAPPQRGPHPTGEGSNEGSGKDPDVLRLQIQGRWKLSFSLFLLGFVLLIVVAKRSWPAGEAWALRLAAAALCVGAFFVARQAHRKSRG